MLLVLLTVSTVSAHAKLVKSSPAPGAVLGTAPSQVQLWFDEPPELSFSEVQVLNASRQRVETGELKPVPGDPYSLIAPLQPTGDGSYNVIWKVLSASDGHITRGVFAFGVGTTAGTVAAPVDSGSSNVGELSPLSAFIRWLSLLTLLALVGGFIFRFFRLERSLEVVNAGRGARQVAQARWLQLMAAALVLFFLANLAELALQVTLVADQLSFTAIASILLNSRYGLLWLMRLGLVGACAVLILLEARRVRVPYADYALIVLGNVALFTRSLNSHSAAAGNFSLPVFADWLHLLGVAIWVGGLFSFAWIMPFLWRALDPKSRGAWIAWLIPQFSIVAIGSIIVIALTGVYNSLEQVPTLTDIAQGVLPSFAELAQSIYNDALASKVLLFFVMLAFGALNLLVLSPRFRRFVTEPDQSARLFTQFRLTVGAEVVLGLTIIFLAGILTLTVPPRSEPEQTAPAVVQQAQPQPVLLIGYPAEDVQVQLEISPSPGAPTEFTARVTDRSGQPLEDIQRVIFNFMYLNEDTGAQVVNAEGRDPTTFVTSGSYLSLDGMWRVQVTVRRRGLEDQAVVFPYYIEPQATEVGTPVAAAQLELARAEQAMNSLTALRSTQNLNDGAGGISISHYDYQAPDRTRFTIEGQGESIAIGADQYFENKDGQWTQRGRVEPFVFPDFDFADSAQATRLGRTDRVDGEDAQIILFDAPNTSGTDLIHYAYWVSQADRRVLQLAMVTDAHYMIQTYGDFNAGDIAITAPTNLAPVPTAAPVVEGSSSPLTAAVQGSPRPKGFVTGDLEGDGALVLVVVGIVALLVGSSGKRTRAARIVTLGTGAAAVLGGIGLFIDAVNGTTAAAQNVPVNTARASSGQLIYEQNCAVCHGEKGYGDGPGGAALPVKPFDLTTHVLLHDEQYLYATILNGRGYMPAFGSRLSQDQILDVIAYTRLLARNAQLAAGGGTPARPGFTPQP